MSPLLLLRASKSNFVRFVIRFPYDECEPLYEDLSYKEILLRMTDGAFL